MKEKIVTLIEDHDFISKGSGIYVEKETKTRYKGVWASSEGSYTVSVPKKKCIPYK